MNCPDCQELLQQCLDGEPIVATDALEQHLNECADCREQHAAAVRLLDGIKQLPRVKPSANLTASIVAEVMHDRRQRQLRTRRQFVVTMALAASVLLMLLAGYYWLPRTNALAPQPKDHFAEKKNPEVTPQKDPTPPKEEEKPEPPHALSAWQDRLASTTRDHAKVVLVAANLDGMEKLPAVNDLQADPDMQEVSDGVRSVTRNARRAFDFFARELPMPEVGEDRE